MSAWMVSPAHIDLIASWATRYRSVGSSSPAIYADRLTGRGRDELAQATDGGDRLGFFDPQTIGVLLWNENVRSVRARYPDHESPELGAYRFRPPTIEVTLSQVARAVACLDYQSCETPDYRESLGWEILKQISADVLHTLGDEQPWGFDEEHVRPVASFEPTAPNGKRIVGTKELAVGRGLISWNEDGTWDWEGTTEGLYDDQETARDARGHAILYDEEWTEWPADRIHWNGINPVGLLASATKPAVAEVSR